MQTRLEKMRKKDNFVQDLNLIQEAIDHVGRGSPPRQDEGKKSTSAFSPAAAFEDRILRPRTEGAARRARKAKVVSKNQSKINRGLERIYGRAPGEWEEDENAMTSRNSQGGGS